jgi:aspartyl-tRNA(Asn)/glutamyl-tRNA(Gln) amidotransferase subunit B
MEEGSLRADVNVSVRRPGAALGTRTETKNLNSVRFIEQTIDYEARRQIDLIEAGGEVAQETRLFDTASGRTRPMRSKEEAHDYRYFPDPDLLPLVLEEAFIEEIRATLPELPDQKRKRFVEELGLSAYDAGVLVAEKEIADFFETVAEGHDPKIAANWVMGDFFGQLNRAGLEVAESPIGAKQLSGLLDLLADGTLSGRLAKDVFEKMFAGGRDAEAIVEEEGLRQVSDEAEIEALVDRVIADNPDKVAEIEAGKDKLVGWFVGQVMQLSGGKANPQLVNRTLRARLTQS